MCKGSPSSEVLVCTDGIANVGLGALETGEVSEIFLLFFFSLLFLLFSSPYEDFVLHSFFHINILFSLSITHLIHSDTTNK
jgi:hypothetical protein